MKFFDTYENPPPCVGQVMDDEILVERAGYVSAEQRITSLIEAGQRLITARAEQYDSNTGDEMDDFDIRTRKTTYDLADASQDALALKALREKFPITPAPLEVKPPETPIEKAE